MLLIGSNAQLKANDLRSAEEVEEEIDITLLWEEQDVVTVQDEPEVVEMNFIN